MSRSEGRSPVACSSGLGSGCVEASPSLDEVASATTVAQMRTDSATCATTAQGWSRVHTLAAPTRIWAAKSTRAIEESLTRTSRRPESVRTRIAVQSTSSIAIAASARCRSIAVAAPPSVGTSLPSISGQSVNTSCASLART